MYTFFLNDKHGLSMILLLNKTNFLNKHHNCRSGQVEFIVDNVPVDQILSKILRVSPANSKSINCSLSINYSVVDSIHSLY